LRERGDRVAITIVNGYLCTSSCDAAKARTGQDPHPRSEINQTPNSRPAATESAAVTYGGALTGQNAVAPTGTAAPTGATSKGPAPAVLDIRV
jgi:hypothetical protein